MPEALDSVLSQTYENWECIIVNDGATDNTEDIAAAYVKKDHRFIYVKKENGGLSSARNAGLDIAKGEWIQFLDADDYISSEKLRLSIGVVIENPGTALVVSNFKMFIDSLHKATPAFCELSQDKLNFESILFGWGNGFTIPIHNGLFKKVLFDIVRFNEDLKAIEDWVMWLDIFKTGVKAIYLNEPLAYYRNNPTSMTKDNVHVRNNLIAAYKHIIDGLPDNYVKRFTFDVIDRLHHNIVLIENDLIYFKTKLSVKIERKIKSKLNNILRKKRN